MIALAFTVLRFAWPFLLLGGIYLWADYGWCNGACKAKDTSLRSAQGKIRGLEDKLAELDRLRIQQQERWAQLTAAEEVRAKERDEKRRLAFIGLAQRARTDSATAAIRIPSTSLGVLSDAHAAAEPTRPAEPPKDTAAPDPTASQVITWGVEMLSWAAECKARVSDWEQWYAGLREKP